MDKDTESALNAEHREAGTHKFGFITPVTTFAPVLLALICCAIMLAYLYTDGLRGRREGIVSQAEIVSVDSSIYSDAEIQAAIDIIKEDFAADWAGCELLRIRYAGDRASMEEEKERGLPTIVLLSDFKTARRLPKESSLNSSATYNDWNWILVRDPDGSWRHVDHGY